MSKNDFAFGATLIAVLATFGGAIATEIGRPPTHARTAAQAREGQSATRAPACAVLAQAGTGHPAPAGR